MAGNHELYDMSTLMQPFKPGQDMGLFLVNVERAWEKASFGNES